MRIGFDLDGVLANLHGKFAATALRLFPELDNAAVSAPEVGASPEGGEDAQPVTVPTIQPRPSRRQADAVWRELTRREEFWETLDETEPGIVKRLAAVAEERRWEVIFLTNRPFAPGATVQRQSQRWLERLGFAHEGTVRKKLFRRGAWVDDWLFGLTREDWLAANPGETPADATAAPEKREA